MIVIPCFEGEQYLEPLIKSIPPMEEILIVDTGSKDINYLRKYPYLTDFTKKPGFAIGAYILAYEKYPRDEYFFIHDSMTIKGSLDDFRKNDVTGWLRFPFSHGADEYRPYIDAETKDSVSLPQWGIFGPIFYAKRKALDKLRQNKNFCDYPETKQHLCAMERVLPIQFMKAGVTVKYIDDYDPNRLDNLRDYEHFDKFRPNRD
jgi:glycosyltransferase involved in cell wall biosynthesis